MYQRTRLLHADVVVVAVACDDDLYKCCSGLWNVWCWLMMEFILYIISLRTTFWAVNCKWKLNYMNFEGHA